MRNHALIRIIVAAGILAASVATADQAAKPAAWPKLTVVTASAHCDWTWGNTRAWHEERYAQIIRQVLLIMRENPRYVWQLENENEELSPFLKKAAKEWPELIDEFWRRVREGRIEVIAAISNPRLTEVYPETFVRNLVLGKEYFGRHAPGIEQKVYNAIDLMCGSSQIPQILAKADYRYFMFSRPCAKKAVFWRTGLDGTRMISVCQHYGYEGIEVNGVTLQSNSGDDILPSRELAKAALAWDPKEKILATSARYLEEIEKRGGPSVKREGVLDSLECSASEGSIHGNRNLYALSNQNEDLLLSVEKAQVMASAAGGAAARQAMDQAWHDLLSCTGHAILYSWKADYEERLDKTAQTRIQAERSLQEALATVVREIRFQPGRGSPLVVFNFHAWPVSGPVEMLVDQDAKGTALCDADGRDVAVQMAGNVPAGGRYAAFIAENVPACGYKTFYLRRAPGDAAASAAAAAGLGPVENERYRIEMQPEGRLKILDKQRGAMLGAPGAGALGDIVFHDAPQPRDWELNGPLGPGREWSARKDDFRQTRGPVYASLYAKGTFGPHAASREVRLWRGSRRIDYRVEIDAADGCGVFCLRFRTGSSGRVFAGIPFGAEPRENFDREPFRGEYFVQGYPDLYYALRWTDISTNDFGYTLVSPKGMPAGWFQKPAEQSLECILLRVRPMPAGVWGQVHPSMQGQGRHVWQAALAPHPSTWREAASYRDALELHVPLLALSPDVRLGRARLDQTPTGVTGSRDEAASFAEVAPANVVLSSLRLVEPAGAGKSPAWEIRLYETAGRASDVVLRLGRRVGSARETNLLGRPTSELGKIDAAGNEIRFRIPPWKIVTLRVDAPAAPVSVGR